MYQLIRYTNNKMKVLGEYENMTAFCSVVPRLCPEIDNLYIRDKVIEDVRIALLEYQPDMAVNDFINAYRDSYSIANYDEFTYAVQSGARMLLLPGDYENPTMEEVNAIFHFCHGDTKFHGKTRPQYRVINMQIAK